LLIALSGKARRIVLGKQAQVLTVTASSLDAWSIRINGTPPQFATLDQLLTALAKHVGGEFFLPPHAIAFVQFPKANNRACA